MELKAFQLTSLCSKNDMLASGIKQLCHFASKKCNGILLFSFTYNYGFCSLLLVRRRKISQICKISQTKKRVKFFLLLIKELFNSSHFDGPRCRLYEFS